MKHALRIIGGLLVLGTLAVLLFFWLDRTETTTDAYVTGRIHPVAPRVTGTVQVLRVNDNQHVKAGDVLLELDTRDFDVAVEQARAEIERARGQVASAEAQIAEASAAIVAAAASTRKTALDLRRADELVNETPRGISRQEFDAARAAADAAVANASSANARKVAATAARASAVAQVATAEAALHNAQLAYGYTKVIAPVGGYVGKRTVEVGARVNAGQTLLAIVSDDVWVVANFKETQLRGIRPGTVAHMTIDAIPDADFTGKVDSFAPASGSQFALLPPDNATGNFTKVVQRVPVKILFSAEDLQRDRPRIVPGLSTIVKIREHDRQPQ
ncbi:membrane fusion protein, multidrug efflux system [Luteibacter sp. UNCMF331Sha3.1]|uniref:HlyD family secretion protein n=1 Tax=Luteibacter sp. UNCMF331Sha3.1 TaxID=1502760 RepID=UPI0008CDC674|nr:HlyD family secretion protein [Luteibacter sp. UNCMF331Sha3.1]SEM51177.1 membrane fusion protein, multidrug efflux system [Luteibacter sp. UNCMF331Sha3.1]